MASQGICRLCVCVTRCVLLLGISWVGSKTCSWGLKLSFLSFETSDANTASGAAVESTHDALIEMMKCPATCRNPAR